MTADEILQSEDLNELYLENVDLETKIGSLYRQITLSDENADKSDYKAELNTCKAVLKALGHRILELEDKAKHTRDEEGRIRYNFMKIAKTILTKETYEKIRNMSENSLREMKPMFKEMRQNKVAS